MKKFYKENRVFVILMIIALICIFAIGGMALNYVIKSSTKDNYGNRLEGINDVIIDDEMIKTFEENIKATSKVKEVTVHIRGKIVNFLVDFDKTTSVKEAQAVAVKTLESFEEDYRNFYDLQFIFTRNESDSSETTFPMFGYIKAENTTIKWSNNAK